MNRRQVLSGAAATLGLTAFPGAAAGAPQHQLDETDGFDPTVNGYGFRNWTPSDQYFEAPPDPTRARVTELVRTTWRAQARAAIGIQIERLAGPLVDAMATQLHLAVAQRAGSNGHCYGMVLTAQDYFERPDTIPVDRPTASDIEDPTVPVEEPSAPVYEAIVDTQASQFLKFRAWLGRRALLYPDWIDAEAVLADVRAVVESLGTAAVILFDGSLYSHQVLAYGYEDDGDRVRIPIYDPNRPAVAYRGGPATLRFERGDAGLSMEPYGRYTGLLFNRYDRIERATGRDLASPVDHLTVDEATVRGELFPLTLVLVDAEAGVEAVDVAVVDPSGVPMDRVRGTYMDRSRGDYDRMRSCYGAEPGVHRVDVFGNADTDYELRAVVADEDGVIVEATRSASIAAGAVHEYDLTVPAGGDGSLDRSGGPLPESAVVGGVAAAGGAAAGALGYRAIHRRRSTDEGGPDGP